LYITIPKENQIHCIISFLEIQYELRLSLF